MSQDAAKDFFSLLDLLLQYRWIVLAIVVVGVPASVWIIRSGRRSNRALLRKLMGKNYSDEKSLIGIGNSISIDDKARHFAVIEGDSAFVCRADELVSAECRLSSKGNPTASLIIVTTNPALPRFIMTVSEFREDKLVQIHARLLALQKQGGAAKALQPRKEAQSTAAADKILPAVEELNQSIIALTGVARKLVDELHKQRVGHKRQ